MRPHLHAESYALAVTTPGQARCLVAHGGIGTNTVCLVRQLARFCCCHIIKPNLLRFFSCWNREVSEDFAVRRPNRHTAACYIGWLRFAARRNQVNVIALQSIRGSLKYESVSVR